MRVDHGRMMLGDEDKGYNPGYSFHGRMLALAQVEGMMAVIDDENARQMKFSPVIAGTTQPISTSISYEKP